MLLHENKKNQNAKGNKLLISITVLGSAGPIWFVVNEKDLVATVMDTALKSYTHEGRLPVLGSDLNDIMLYCPYVRTDALSPWETIGSQGARNFMSCKKRQPEKLVDNEGPMRICEKLYFIDIRKGTYIFKNLSYTYGN
ncbi:hypothetical protein FNV43_RR24692 [Rhamnella rubrinervis]|uniref:DUF7054 domain-containing protein n=1 Tax=Rhamnella rubrinervis TaxID=2594499 RepID=A0A8K0DTK4_9ROSA|nr:hypothetical protein FNV43_RR24692 [Rhamnella rubrinervis]